MSVSSTAATVTGKSVSYLYVDKAVTITGQGKTVPAGEYSPATTTQNITLNLAQGWNALYMSFTQTTTSTTSSATMAVSVENPALKWSYAD